MLGHVFELSDEEIEKYGHAVTSTVDYDQCFINEAAEMLGILQANLARMTSERQPVVRKSLSDKKRQQKYAEGSEKKGSCVGSVSRSSSQEAAVSKENGGATATRSTNPATDSSSNSHEEAFAAVTTRKFDT
jgi:hypothetical protein